MSRDTAQLLVVDSLDGGGGVPAIAEVPLRPAPSVDAAAVIERLRVWQSRFQRGNATATVKAVRSDWQQYASWCDANDRAMLPCSPDQLEAFLRQAIDDGRKRSTIDRYIYTVDLIHRAAGLPRPCADDTWLDIRKGLTRDLVELKRTKPRQAAALRSHDVQHILATLGTSAHDLRDAALLSLASDTLLRESELVAVEVHHLVRDADGACSCEVPFSKTNQDGAREDNRFVDGDTMVRIAAWLTAAGIERGPVFRPIGGRHKANPDSDTPALRPKEVARIFRRRALAAGLAHAPRISGHSTRVGSANDLAIDGATSLAIQHAGGWTTDRMVTRYTSKAQAGRGAMAQFRGKKGQKGS